MFAIHTLAAWHVSPGSRSLILCLVRPHADLSFHTGGNRDWSRRHAHRNLWVVAHRAKDRESAVCALVGRSRVLHSCLFFRGRSRVHGEASSGRGLSLFISSSRLSRRIPEPLRSKLASDGSLLCFGRDIVDDFEDIWSASMSLARRRPNQAMELTASRCTASLSIASAISPAAK